MFFYEIIECHSMSTHSIIVYSEKFYSKENFNVICNNIKESYNGSVSTLQEYIKDCLIEDYNFKEIITSTFFSYEV